MAPPNQRELAQTGPQPRFGAIFDPWHSASTGHQAPESAPGTGWRDIRTAKLRRQFRNVNYGTDSGVRPAQAKKQTPKEKLSVKDMILRPGAMGAAISSLEKEDDASPLSGTTAEERLTEKRRLEDEAAPSPPRGIFAGLVVYVNGSTAPLISDHKLKKLLSENGAHTAIHLGRRQVTHVILGRPAARRHGAGGGLAGGKLEREIRRVGGCGVKYVGVEWVLESLQAGRRLPEARFATLKIATEKQRSVYGLYAKQ